MKYVFTLGSAMKERVSTISSKGQVTIPVDVRRQLGVGAANKVRLVVTEAGTVEVRRVRFTLESVLGSLASLLNESVDLEREIEEAREQAAAKISDPVGTFIDGRQHQD
jgi:AbrB family looped-hinge helix DNA binding protein